MRQYKEMKMRHPDAILLFRVGDFYECFGNDATVVSEALGTQLSGIGTQLTLTGFPEHQLDTALPKLVRAGKKVAICEQLEEPKRKNIH